MARKNQSINFEQMFGKEPKTYEVIVVSCQEAKMTKKTSFIYDLANYLGRFDFITIASVRMWEMLLVAFVRLDKLPFVTYVQSSQVPAGVAKILGNKGGLQISFKLHHNLFNFVNVHLVHGAKRYDKRNEMMSDIVRKMRN
jgi:hypothetical protein